MNNDKKQNTKKTRKNINNKNLNTFEYAKELLFFFLFVKYLVVQKERMIEMKAFFATSHSVQEMVTKENDTMVQNLTI